MKINLDSYAFDSVLVCLWVNEKNEWEGVIKDNLPNIEARAIVSAKHILIIKD